MQQQIAVPDTNILSKGFNPPVENIIIWAGSKSLAYELNRQLKKET